MTLMDDEVRTIKITIPEIIIPDWHVGDIVEAMVLVPGSLSETKSWGTWRVTNTYGWPRFIQCQAMDAEAMAYCTASGELSFEATELVPTADVALLRAVHGDLNDDGHTETEAS